MSFTHALKMMGTGMPLGPSKTNASGMSDPGAALQSAMAAHKKGDHRGAKKHALKAVKLLHAITGPANVTANPAAVAPAAP